MAKKIGFPESSTPPLAPQARAAPPIPMVVICICVCPTSIGRSPHGHAPTQSWREVRCSKNVQKSRFSIDMLISVLCQYWGQGG